MENLKSKMGGFLRYLIIATVLIVVMLILANCTTTKEIHQEQSKQQTQATSAETSEVNTASETNTETKTLSETEIVEAFDTVVRVWPVIDGKVSDKPVDIPIRGERTIHRKDYSDQKQQRKEQEQTTLSRKEQNNQKSEVLKKDREVTRTGMVGWIIGIVVVAVLVGVAILMRRMKWL
ncbi:MAG: hypothetical protein WCP32_18275 [Bacteroidota bacterium]